MVLMYYFLQIHISVVIDPLSVHTNRSGAQINNNIKDNGNNLDSENSIRSNLVEVSINKEECTVQTN